MPSCMPLEIRTVVLTLLDCFIYEYTGSDRLIQRGVNVCVLSPRL